MGMTGQQQSRSAAPRRQQQNQKTGHGRGHWRDYSNFPCVSNLRSFFAYTSPFVPVQRVPCDSCMGDLNFTLRDLWACYEEWSAYGAEVPITLGRSGEQVTCIYAPSLSGIQIFEAESSTRRHSTRIQSDDDAESRSDEDLHSSEELSSDDSSVSSMGDSESDTDGKQHHNPDRGSVLQQHRSNGKSCKVLYQYFEDCSPYERLPLTDKIEELALDEDGFTGLLTLRSCDIHPASWYSVAWYPIYQLPSGMPIRDLHACFLTFHSLTLGQEHGVQLPQDVLAFRPCPPPVSSDAEGMLEQRYKEAEQDLGGADLALLHPFAFAPYRMQGRLWQEAEKDSIVSHSMLAAAGMWVQRRQVAHYDLEFFMRNAPWNMRR